MRSDSLSTVVKKYLEVINRLDAVGTSREALLEVVEAVVAARADSTDYDPSGTAGWRGWQMGTRRSREVHVGIGDWQKDDTDQVPSIINRKLGVRIVVCNTDDSTCIDHASRRGPQNRSKKGAATDRAVSSNQGTFIEALEASIAELEKIAPLKSKRKADAPLLTYYLCVYVEGDDIRAELSCPMSVVNGYFDNFEERIFIVGGETEPPAPVRRKKTDDDDDGSDYTITVKRK